MKQPLQIIVLGLAWMAISFTTLAQPVVNSLSKYSAPAGEVISINGSGFNAPFQVNFGAGKAVVESSTSTQINVIVPYTATYGPVTVTNTSSGRSSSSSRPFTLSFGGSGALDDTKFDAQVNVDIAPGLLTWDVCLCHLDDDEDLDAVSTFRQTGQITVLNNNTGPANTTVDFSVATVSPGNPVTFPPNTDRIICEDLDGDGRNDLIFTSVESTSNFHVRIYPNESSMTLGTPISFTIPNRADATNRSASRLRVADLDMDGRKDLIIASEEDPYLFIYLNTSSVGSISVNATPYSLNLPDMDRATLIEVGELNGDGIPDLAVASNVSGQVNLVKNLSSPGFLNFATPVLAGNSAARTVMKMGDLDLDGLMDIAFTSNSANRVAVMRNTTSSRTATISMASEVSLTNLTQAYGLDLGDLNGDGLVDIAATSLNNGIHLYQNTTSGSTLSFAAAEAITLDNIPALTTQNAARHIKIADVNTDSKPDLVFAFNSRDSQTGIFSVIANRTCIDPVILPSESLSYCNGQTILLSAPYTTNATYAWTEIGSGDGTLVFSATDTREVEVTITGGSNAHQVQLEIIYALESCTGLRTETKTFNFSSNQSPIASITEPGAPYCAGDAITLSSANTADNYYWTLPNGFEVNTQSVNIASAGPQDAGMYILRVLNNGACPTDPDTVILDIDIPPSVTIANESGDNYFCQGVPITLAVPSYTGFDYEWFESGVTTGITTNTISVSDSGVYTLEITSQANGCSSLSDPYEVYGIDAPMAMMDAVAGICLDVPMTFTATSTGNGNFTMTHSWDFKDGTSVVTGASVQHTFTSAGTYAVELSSAYNEIDMCADIVTMNVTVSAPTSIAITAPQTEKCASDTVVVELPQNFQSYLWSTGDTTYFTNAITGNDVTSVTLWADVVTDIGCSVRTDSITISNYPNSGMTITSTDATIVNDTIQLETGVTSVSLTSSVFNGTNYTWTSADPSILSNTSGETTTVFPRQPITAVTAIADGEGGCVETRTIVLIRPGLHPAKAFSPNGDGINDCWEIINLAGSSGCKLYIFDSRGRILYTSEEDPFTSDCAWDGTTVDSNVPYKGIYYFVLKCSDGSQGQSGTILLAK
ncbi:FG-GAP-like repeat-containing protein [Marinoscillum sp. MHG1-6]|uniref:FG-GAP-like repeat-containing protein n=1 Tax=Marinoscillum sp. MHG1-6 TaxID=2959627 RepID=UPI00215795FB|nr:FG-GAP-like repeat-containing protein [Marinoscillum sp. MHG1-6]